MPRYVFPGYYKFVANAARQLGHPEAEVRTRAVAPLSALANLCAQASTGDPAHAPAIMAKAAAFQDRLHAASLAADLMIADVDTALGLKPVSAQEKRAARPPEPPESDEKSDETKES